MSPLPSPLTVVKIGGNIIDDAARLHSFLQHFAAIPGHKILVHGGGKLATQLAARLEIPQQMVDGRRITDAQTLDVVTMVYAGLINKQIVARLQALDANAIGLCGADGNAICSHKRRSAIDYGFVGDVDAVNTGLLTTLLTAGHTLVLSPITHDATGQLLNTNADTIAQETARAMARHYQVQLVYSFEKAGVLRNVDDASSVIPRITPATYAQLKADNVIFAGMLPKLDNAFAALQSGVQQVIIGQAEDLPALLNGRSGTTLAHA